MPDPDHLKSIVEAIAWPAVVLIVGLTAIFVFRGSIARFLGRTTKISFGKEGFEIITGGIAEERVEASAAQIVAMRESAEGVLHPLASKPQMLAHQYVTRWGAEEVTRARMVFKRPYISLAAADNVTRRAIFEVLNFLEEMAVAIRKQRADEPLIRQAVGGKVMRYWDKKGARWVDELRRKHRRPHFYENLQWLIERWRATPS